MRLRLVNLICILIIIAVLILSFIYTELLGAPGI
jgi:hypothetical protein